MATSGTIAAYWSTTYTTARWEFAWQSSPTSTPGETKVSWTLKTLGRSSTPTWLATNCDFKIYYNGTTTERYSKSWIDPSGAEASFNDKFRDSGEFIVNHDSSGVGEFRVYMHGNIWEHNTKKTEDEIVTLDANYPYSQCLAPSSASITISPAIQKPGGKITISWDPGTFGTANDITGYKVQYKIGDSWSSEYSTTATSKEFTLSSDASRGAMITAKVKAIGKISGYDSDYSDEGGSCTVNTLPGAPIISVNKDKLPSSGGTVTFTLSAGSSNTGQTTSLYYSTSKSGTKRECQSDFSPTINSTTDYYFWTYDGLEYDDAEGKEPITITVNSKPTVSLNISGTIAENETATFTKGNNGQSNNNTYTFGFVYNNVEYTLVSSWSSTTYSIGDMRKQLSDRLSTLYDSSTYTYKFWVLRNDGLENSTKVYSSDRSLSIPKFNLSNDNGEAASFCNKVKIELTGNQSGSYSTVSFDSATTNGLELDTTGLAWGEKLDKLRVNNSFYVTPQDTLSKVYAIDIVPSVGLSSPFSPNTFCTYTSQTLNISFVSRTGANYGVDSVPTLTITGPAPISINGTENNGTWNYSVAGTTLYERINTDSSTLSLEFSIKNKFNSEFKKTFVLNLDNTMEAITYLTNPIDLYPGMITNTSTKYPSLNKWQYIKESMPFYLDFSVLAFDNPRFQFELFNFNNSGKWTSYGDTNLAYSTATTSLNKYGGIGFNTPPKSYALLNCQLPTLEEITQDHLIKARIKVTTHNHEMYYNFFDGEELLVKRHQAPQASFTKANYRDGTLSTEWKVDDYGYSDSGNLIKIGLKIKQHDQEPALKDYPNNSLSMDWTEFSGFQSGSITYEFLNIAPRLESTMSVSTNSNVTPAYQDEFTTIKTSTENFVYITVYNIAPTVSYRKNFIGINTTDLSKSYDTVVQINPYNSRHIVYLNGEERSASIDLLNGGLNNFVMDCGSWDGTTGGIVDSTTPGGSLAAIAYTGELGDLEQRRSQIIIISGGSSDEEI